MADKTIKNPQILKSEKIIKIERVSEHVVSDRNSSTITGVTYRITTEQGVYDIHNSRISKKMIPAVGYSIISDTHNDLMYFVFKERQH